jgi:hypothetical protein
MQKNPKGAENFERGRAQAQGISGETLKRKKAKRGANVRSG